MRKNSSCVISVDMGTGSVRACLVDETLKILQKSQKPLTLQTDSTGKAEQDAEAVVNASLACISEGLVWAENASIVVEAISFSNAVSSLVPLNENYYPIGPVFTYADVRSHNEADKLKEIYSCQAFKHTACPVHASYWLSKFQWLKSNYPNLFESRYFCTLKDLLIFRLSGEFVTDYSNAVATGMCDVQTGDWDDELLKIADISREQLPKIFPTSSVIQAKGTFSSELLKNISIVLGATDGVLSSLGAGAFNSGQVTTMIGSSGACRIAADSPLISDEENVIWSYPLDDGIWIRGGAMNSGGLVTQWAAKNFYPDQDKDIDNSLRIMLECASKINPGADGLTFLPYLFGERAPIWNEHARGVFFGIHNMHQTGHFARATVEGVLCALYSIFNIIRAEYAGEIEIRASGGYLQSELMLQIQADMFGHPVGVTADLEGSSIGAAALAYKAIGKYISYSVVGNCIPIVKTYQPNVGNYSIYQEQIKRFKSIYTQLKPLMGNQGVVG